MKTKLLISIIAIAAITAIFAFATAPFAQTTEPVAEIQTHDLDGITAIKFKISKANIHVAGSNHPKLELKLEKSSAGFDPEASYQTIERKGDTLVIEIEYKRSFKNWLSLFFNDSGYRSATLQIPNNLKVSVETSGGNIRAHALDSSVNLTTTGGNIHLQNIQGQTKARSSGGNIAGKNLSGKARLQTSGGNITIEGNVSAMEAHTTGGNIKAILSSRLVEPINLSSSGGSTTIKLPKEQAFDLLAKANGGTVSLLHSGTFDGELGSKEIDGSINGGGPQVAVTTSGGHVYIGEI